MGVGRAELARVDRALQDALARQRQSSTVQTSPVPFEDVQLIAGCGADETACLQLIANQLGSDALLVRRLVGQPDGRALLTLTAYVTPSDEPAPPREVSALIDWTEAQGAERAVRQLMAQLSPPPAQQPREVLPTVVETPPEPVLEVAPAREETRPSRRWPSRLGWTAAAVGCGLLAVGVISGTAARRDEKAYGRADITDARSVDRAHTLLDDAERHARVANGLIIGGAVVTTAGLATVLWRWAAQRGEERNLALHARTRSRLDGTAFATQSAADAVGPDAVHQRLVARRIVMRATLFLLVLAWSVSGCSASENANHTVRCDSNRLCPSQMVCYREFCIPDEGLPYVQLDAGDIAAAADSTVDRGSVDTGSDTDTGRPVESIPDAQPAPGMESPPERPPAKPPEQGPTAPVVDAGTVVPDAGRRAANSAALVVCLPSCASQSPICLACLSSVLSRNPEVCSEAEGVDPLVSGLCDFLCTSAECRGRR